MRLLKPVLAGLTVLLILGPFSHKTYAHFPASVGNLTAILHIEPDDYPTVNKREKIYLIFNDAARRFRLIDCSCSLVVSYGGNTLLSTTLAPPAAQGTIYDTAGLPFTFIEPGDYQIKLVGQPTATAAFERFSLSWKISVSAVAKPPGGSTGSGFLKYFGVILGLLLIFGGLIFVLS